MLLSTSKIFNFIWALLCVANQPIALTKNSTKSIGSELHKEKGAFIKFDEIDTGNSTSQLLQKVTSENAEEATTA